MEERRDLVIQIRNLKKKYTLGQYNTSRVTSGIKARLGRLLGRQVSQKLAKERSLWRDFYALKGVDLDVYRGDTLGIIGLNGSGKSTLLKLISRITAPTEGEIKIRGKSASMLEIGTGFHGDMTGRENIYLNGTILGMTRAEIAKKMDRIIEFSECGEFIDTPVKRYSSGMYVRLAFSVSAFLDSDVLVMDEVLAVGDSHFQKKCIEKMYSAAHDENRTVLFVSHNMNSIRQLCSRCIVLDHGEKVFDGDVERAIQLYTNINAGATAKKEFVADDAASGIKLIDAALVNHANSQVIDDNIRIRLAFSSDVPRQDVRMQFILRRPDGAPVGMCVMPKGIHLPCEEVLDREFSIDIAQLAGGSYSIDVIFGHEAAGSFYPLARYTSVLTMVRSFPGGAYKIKWDAQNWGYTQFPAIQVFDESL